MNKKRISAFLLAAFFVFGATACESKPAEIRTKMAVNGSKVSTSHIDGEFITTTDGYTMYKPAGNKTHTSTNQNSNQNTGGDAAIIHTGNFEKPYVGDASVLFGGMSSPYDKEATALRNKIRNTKDTLKAAAGHNTLYVSYRGDDVNNGFSKEAPLATVTAAYRQARSGDVVLFERGGVYRGNISMKSGVSLGAYGTGEKPCIYGSLQNYADPSLWEKHDTNVWKISVPSEQGAIGAIIFNNGEKAADMLFEINDVKNFGNVADGEPGFCYKNHYVYLYSEGGNPGKVYKSIEFAGDGHVLDSQSGAKNITIENLCIKYGGEHGISFYEGAQNITIRGCEVGFIGGCLLGSGANSIRYGNAIQFWSSCRNIKVQNCWTYQCFDTGITPQYQSSSGGSIMKDILIDSNLVEYTNYGIEYFNLNGQTTNLTISNNMVRFSGYGLFPNEKRTGGKSATRGGTATLQAWQHPCEMVNFKVTGNYFDTSARYLIAGKTVTLQEPTIPGERAEAREKTIHSAGYPLVGNYYCLQTSAVYPVDTTLTPGSKPDANGLFYAAVYARNGSLGSANATRPNSYEVMKSEIEMIDPNPKGIKFVNGK